MKDLILNEWRTGKVNGVDVKYRVVLKRDSKFMKFISYLLFWQSKTFMENYYTTIGRTVYTPVDEVSEHVLEHELIHVHDYQGAPVLFMFSYLFLLPAVWTWRSKWERRAYAWQMQRLQYFDVEWVKSQFCSAAYLWMWPFPKKIEKWVEQVKSGEYAPIKSVEL
jgi:hypothetical protein